MSLGKRRTASWASSVPPEACVAVLQTEGWVPQSSLSRPAAPGSVQPESGQADRNAGDPLPSFAASNLVPETRHSLEEFVAIPLSRRSRTLCARKRRCRSRARRSRGWQPRAPWCPAASSRVRLRPQADIDTACVNRGARSARGSRKGFGNGPCQPGRDVHIASLKVGKDCTSLW